MHLFANLYACVVLASTILTPLTQACSAPTNSSDAFVLGDDGPADPATLGYTMNHFSLLVNDMEASMHFYGKILGMRHLFTFHASSTFEIVYMGYSHGGKNGTGFQSGEELYKEKSNIEGLIEFIQTKDCTKKNNASDFKSSTKRVNTFSHVGLVVPDTRSVQARMEKFGVEILKPVGKMPVPGTATGELLEKAFGIAAYTEAEQKEALAGIANLGFKNFLIVADPDGNVLEIQSQV